MFKEFGNQYLAALHNNGYADIVSLISKCSVRYSSVAYKQLNVFKIAILYKYCK